MLDLALLFKVFLVAGLFRLLFCLLLLSHCVIFQTLLAQVSFLLSDLLDSINSGLFFQAVLKSDLIRLSVQDWGLGRLWLHYRRLLHEARRSVRIVASEERTSRLALLRSVSSIDCVNGWLIGLRCHLLWRVLAHWVNYHIASHVHTIAAYYI